MRMLHTVNKSPFERNTLDSCLRLVEPGSSVLLIEDGVVAAVTGTIFADKIEQAMKNIDIYVLAPDVNARGFSKSNIMENIKAVDYDGFVNLVAEHESVHAWL